MKTTNIILKCIAVLLFCVQFCIYPGKKNLFWAIMIYVAYVAVDMITRSIKKE